MKKLHYRTTIAGFLVALAGLVSIDANAQIALNPSSKVTAVTSKPGFIWRIFNNSKNQVNSTQRTEDALAGLLKDTDGSLLPNNADPSAQGVAIAPASAPSPDNAPIQFEIESVINVDQAAGSNGAFQPDDQMPGIPGTDGSTDGTSVEIITYLDLAVGTYTFGVASDDGFRTSAGNLKDAFQGTVLGEYNGGRGSADTLYSFSVTEAGVYPFRTTYEEGGGGSTIEWFSVKADGTKVLINDAANGGIKAYRAASGTAQPPYVKSVSPLPAPRQVNGVSSSVTVVLADGDTVAIDDSSIDFKIDGKAVTDKKRDGKTVTLTYTPEGIQFPNESHTASLTFKGAGGFTRTENWSFRNLKNVILPATAVAGENFDSLAEGALPAGWVATNFTVPCDEGEDPTNQKSDTFKNWAVISTETMPLIDDSGITSVNTSEKLNGVPITIDTFRTKNVLYAESDSRCNGTNPTRPAVATAENPTPNYGQVQFIVTKAFNLSAVKNPVLSFSSGYYQNQDSFGSCEYSVDGGKTFLPVVIYLDLADILVKADGTTDGPGTLTAQQTDDIAIWTDNGVVKGNAFGDALLCPINPAISDYIAPRINDDSAEGKRIEIFRLPAAANQADVRLRFAATGSDSWYFYVDNIAFYDIAPATTPATGQPVELGQTVNGFQDDFTGATRDPNWKARGPGGDLYQQADGLLRVTVRVSDPNHLLYEAPGYSTNVQEVLARIRITAFGVNADGPRAGIGVGVGTNSQGINLNFRNFTQDNVAGRQLKLLDDGRAWGPAGIKIDWQTNAWYWLRLRQDKNANGGTDDVFAKVWAADGATPEPASWQNTWNYIPTRTERAGFAGITGSSIDGVGNFEVDYFLVKAEGLPSIKVDFAPQGPAPTAPALTGIRKVSATQVQVEWNGVAALQSADSVTGPWTPVANAATPYKATASGVAKFYELKY